MADSTVDWSSLDSSGESFGSGLDTSALDYSGSDGFGTNSFDDTMQGSSVALDFSGGVTDQSIADFGNSSTTDPWASLNLSGVSDPPPSWWESDPASENGSGTAASAFHPLDTTGHNYDQTSSVLNALGKFGSSIGQLFAQGTAPGASSHPQGYGNGNPNFRRPTQPVSKSHVSLLIAILFGLGVAVAFGGGRNG